MQTSSDARQDNSTLIEKKSWDIALGPLKQLPMNLFIMWMAGNSISIFPIMMVGMMFIRPIQAFLSIQHTFNMIEGRRKALQQVVYTLGNIVGLGLAVYKCQVMGLLPTHPSDWLAFVEPQKRMEWSGGGLALWLRTVKKYQTLLLNVYFCKIRHSLQFMLHCLGPQFLTGSLFIDKYIYVKERLFLMNNFMKFCVIFIN